MNFTRKRFFTLFLILSFFCISFSLKPALQVYAAFNYELGWGTSGSGNGEFNFVWGVATDSSGNVYVADAGNDRIQKFDADGNYLLQWGTEGTANGELNEPTGIVVNSLDEVIVSDLSNHRIQVFDTDGNFLRVIGGTCGGVGNLCGPWGVAVDSLDNIYVTDGENGATDLYKVNKFTRLGVFVSSWGTAGSGDGELNGTSYGIAIDSSDNVFIADQNNDRVQIFSPSGVFISKFGTSGSGNGEFSGTRGIAIDLEDTVYVVDGNNRVQTFVSGVYQSQWGVPGVAPGELPGPYYIAVNELGKIYVGDSINRVQRFENTDFSPPAPTPTPTVTPIPIPTSSGAQTSQSSGTSTTVCEMANPQKPKLFHLAWNTTAATLYFEPVPSPVSAYVISYGRSPEADEYNQRFDAYTSDGAQLYTISELQPGIAYYFKIRAFNDCKPGEWSDVLSTRETARGAARIVVNPVLEVSENNDATPAAIQEIRSAPKPLITTINRGDIEQKKVQNNFFFGFIEAFNIENIGKLLQAAAISGIIIVLPKLLIDIGSSLSAIKELPLYLLRLLLSLLEVLGLRKRTKSWGVVFDSVTGQPIDPAVVTLFANNGKSQLGMKITDMAGRFGFLVDPGTYTITVKKTDYVFPSKRLQNTIEFKDYKNLYFGEDISFTDKDLLQVNIPLDPMGENWNQKVKDQYYSQYKQVFKDGLVNRLMTGILVINILMYLIFPNQFNLIMLVLSLVLFVTRKFFVHKKSWGVVFEKESRKIRPGVTVRAFKTIAGKELSSGSVITDKAGRYYMLLQEGEQYLQVEEEKDGKINILKRVGPFKIKKESSFTPDIAI
jgi:hypothetical protein